MPIDRQPISVSQLAELLGVDPATFIAVEKRVERTSDGSWQGGWFVVTEGAEMQASGSFPQLTTGGKKIGTKKKGGRKSC